MWMRFDASTVIPKSNDEEYAENVVYPRLLQVNHEILCIRCAL